MAEKSRPEGEPKTFKRQFPRRNFASPVGTLVRGNYEVSRALMIGEGGMQIYVPQEMNPGDKIVVTFKIPNSDFVSIRAEVRSVVNGKTHPMMGQAYGLQFQNISFEQKRLIRNFVAERVDSEPDI